MTAEPNREVAVLNAALELAAEQRGAYLAEACAGDPVLRQQVEALLQAHEEAEGFLEAPPTGLGCKRTAPLLTPLTETAGHKIGRYKLLQQIGEGGCGVVYMAEQEEPVRRRVALKVIKLGMDTKQVIARFEAERQALALMDHPNIAKVLDAGTTETGRPFFVMELVRGVKITDFCDENQVSTQDRLKLFIQVCQAIQHAHQKGVIHRDIKPSNILVTLNDGVPVPKVIDFGIAKATAGRLTDQTLFTAFEQFIGTPAYMSPEQAVMTSLDIDTRSDIYSLGVLIYELLTSRTPFDQQELLAAGLDEMRRTIREKQPPKPSTRLGAMAGETLTTTAKHRQTEAPKLIHLVRGDLDWIVMKCLEKDRARRYETANGLARDIERHLNCEPVVARPPSRLYEFQKTVRRHKFGFAAGVALITVLAVGVIISTMEAIRATRAEREQARQRQIAVTKEKTSEQVAQLLKDMLDGVGPSVAMGRDTTMLREILDRTDERISKDLKDQPEAEIELRLTLAQVYYDLELYRKLEETARAALQLARAHFGNESLAAAEALGQLGRALFYFRELDEAETVTRGAIAMNRKLRGDDSLQEAASLLCLASILRHKFDLHETDVSKLAEAETASRAALAIYRKRSGNDADADKVAHALLILRLVLKDAGKLDQAEAAVRESLSIRRTHFGDDHPFTAESYASLGETVSAQNKFEEAEMYYRKALPALEKLGGAGKWGQSWAHSGFAYVLWRRGKVEDAEIHYRAALAIARKTMGTNHADLSFFIAGLAGFLQQMGQLAEARPLAEEAVAICQRSPDQVERRFQQAAFDCLRAVLKELGDTAALERLDSIRQLEKKPEPH